MDAMGTYENTFTIAGSGAPATGDTVVLNIDPFGDAAAEDYTFTYSDSGVWEVDTAVDAEEDFSLTQRGTEFTLVVDAVAGYTVDEELSSALFGAVDTEGLDISGNGNATEDAAADVVHANGYLAFVGVAGVEFEVSAEFRDNAPVAFEDGAGADVVINNFTDYAVGVATSTAAAAAPDLNTTITDIDADDVIDVDGIITGDVRIATSLLDENLADATVIVLTEDSYASFALAEAAVTAAIDDDTDTDDVLVIWESSVTGAISMYFDNDVGSTDIDTTAEQTAATIISFTGVTTGDLATILSVDSFQFG